MFSLPQGEGGIEDPDIQIVDVTDDSHALDLLLRWCDPRAKPLIDNLDDIQVALMVANK